MKVILKSIHTVESKFNRIAERFAFRHPYLTYLAMFIGVPVVILSAVAFCTAVVTLPLALIFGWL